MKRIIVTGASRGIGYALVQQLSAQGHHLMAVSRNADKLLQLQQSCEEHVGRVEIKAADLTNPDVAKELASIYKDEAVDVIINNAGALLNKPYAEITHEEQHYIYNVNVFGVMNLIRGLVPSLKKSESAHVVNIGSMGGFQGSAKFPGLSVYSSSKAALASLTECLAEEYKEEGLRFNCLALGAVQTEMLEEAFPGYQAPLQAEEMAKFIGDFALKSHHYINGKIIPVSISTP